MIYLTERMEVKLSSELRLRGKANVEEGGKLSRILLIANRETELSAESVVQGVLASFMST